MICMALIHLGTEVNADQVKADKEYQTVYAARLFQRYAKGSEFLTRKGLGEDWNRVSKADRNGDGAIPFQEYVASIEVPTIEWEGNKRTNIKYKSTPEEDLYFDLYLPQSESHKKTPLLVYIHGGGWGAGSKDLRGGGVVEVFRKMAAYGIACASVNYRLTANPGIYIRDCVTDVKDMVRYIAKHSDELGIDPNRVFTLGHSAGGHLSQMLLLVPPDAMKGDLDLADYSYTTIAGVSWAGPCSFENINLFTHPDGTTVSDRFGPRITSEETPTEERTKRYAEVSPVHYLKEGGQPLLMIHGDMDKTIPFHHGIFMKEQADELGARVENLILEGVGHGVGTAEAVKATVDFVLKHLQ